MSKNAIKVHSSLFHLIGSYNNSLYITQPYSHPIIMLIFIQLNEKLQMANIPGCKSLLISCFGDHLV